MRNTFLIFLLVLFSTHLRAQVNLNYSIVDFKSNCSEPIVPEDTILAEFMLLELSIKKDTTTLNFEIIANCAQQQTGQLNIIGDTLRITETDVRITQTKYEEVDSAGFILEITEETHVAEITSCDCLVNFFYQFSTSIKKVNFLTFHDRTYMLKEM